MSDCDEGMTETVAEAQEREKAGTPLEIARRTVTKEKHRQALMNLQRAVRAEITGKNSSKTLCDAADRFSEYINAHTTQTIPEREMLLVSQALLELLAVDPMSRKL